MKLKENKMKKTAKRIDEIELSGIRKAFLMAQKIKDPIDLSIGQPDFDVPSVIKEKAIESIRSGFNHYTPTAGIPELRGKIKNKLAKKNKIRVRPEQVLVTSGTTGGIFLSFFTLIDPGDEVIILDPYFVAYKELAKLCGAKIKIVSTYPDFQPNISLIKKAVGKKTKLIVLNSPNNPTGAVYKEKTIKEIVKIAKENDIFILSDEVYEDFIYEGKHFSPQSIYKNTITLNGFSKSGSMTGWRIGYASGPKEVIDKMAKLQQLSFVCAPSFAQKAALTALEYDNGKEIENYRKKRDVIFNGLKDHYPIVKPEGAFYIFIKVPYGDERFVKKLLQKRLIAVPGSAFSGNRGYIRISYATSDESIKKAVSILTEQ